MRTPRTRWGIEMQSGRGRWSGPLGVSHLPTVVLPDCVDRWPVSYYTRAQARTMAGILTRHHERYLRWRYRPVKLTITVRW